ncbi:MAG: EAL domain-containing protein, partial [Clostridium sp.]|nr:EAL domain-containing protein [Clostridium sp.]
QYGKYFATYDDKLRNKLLREQAITDGMESALEEGQFVIYLQPKYRIQDFKLAGAEALIRWNHPEWGFQSPAEFIPLFEKNGFITKLDQFVWDRTCAALRKWDDLGIPPIAVSVNVSRADIYNANLADFLVGTVNKYGLPPSRLHLEITESAYTEDPNQIIETVVNLRKLGFIIEMDDFGSGYSSLNMLNEMPLDILKLDMKFIQSETAKPNKQGILRFIMGLARWMKLSVVAEGVETPEQMERLREIGCDYAQGYYMAKPMPCDEFEALLKQESRGEEQAADQADEQADSQRRVLLIADEDEQYRRQVRETFGSRFKVVEAADGEAALSCIADYESRIAVVVLSMTLSGPDGFSVLEILQREKAVWNISAIATAPADAGMEERALEMGADDFAVKPHTQKSLEHRVLQALRVMETREWGLELQQEACKDYLTGLLTRRGFQAAMDSLRKEDGPLARYLFDLDNLKDINDTFGHAEGDRHITQFAQLLRGHTRESDILSRYGGDEFVVVMRQMKSDEDALRKGEEICRAIREIEAEGRRNAACTAGIVRWHEAGTAQELIARADQALYRAKRDNKGGCSLWGDDKKNDGD